MGIEPSFIYRWGKSLLVTYGRKHKITYAMSFARDLIRASLRGSFNMFLELK